MARTGPQRHRKQNKTNEGNYNSFHSTLSTSRLGITSLNSQVNFSNDTLFERFYILTTVLMDIIMFSDATPFSLVQYKAVSSFQLSVNCYQIGMF